MSQANSDSGGALIEVDDDDLLSGELVEGEFGDAEMFDDANLEHGDTLPVGAKAVPDKVGFSIYTVMLILSFVFLMLASIFLFIEVGRLTS